MTILNHLKSLTGTFDHKGQKVFYINVYSKPNSLGQYIPLKASGEGIACVDDVARAVVLALEIYNDFQDSDALVQAKNWLSFLSYMQDKNGHFTNFICDSTGKRTYRVLSSHKGGAWWSARAKWALAKSFRLIGKPEYLEMYRKTRISEGFDADVAAILLLAALEVIDLENPKYVSKLVEQIVKSRTSDGFFAHKFQNPNIHLWGYHQLEAVAKAVRVLNRSELLKTCQMTVETLVADAVEHNFYYEYPSRTQEGLCAYCISPLARGLYELYLTTEQTRYAKMFGQCLDWFDGKNSYQTVFYDRMSGRCLDGIHQGVVSDHCGAESAIEAGFCEVRRPLINSSKNLNGQNLDIKNYRKT